MSESLHESGEPLAVSYSYGTSGWRESRGDVLAGDFLDVAGEGYIYTSYTSHYDGFEWSHHYRITGVNGAANGNTYHSSNLLTQLLGGGFVTSHSSHGNSVYSIFNAEGDFVTELDASAAGDEAATLENGSFITTGSNDDGTGSGANVIGRHFDDSGISIGTSFTINTYTQGDQRDPSVATLEGGEYVVVWESYGQDSSSWGIFGQRFDASDSPVGAEFQVNTTTENSQKNATVVGLVGGGFVVVWDSLEQNGGSRGIYGQRFNEDGSSNGLEFLVNDGTDGAHNLLDAAPTEDGGFVVAGNGDGEGFVQRFDSSGQPYGEPLIFSGVSNLISLDEGGVLVVAGQRAHSYALNGVAEGENTITGAAELGERLTADASNVTDPDGMPTSGSYNWLRDGVLIAGANRSIYVLVEADIGSQISSVFSYTDGAGNVERIESALTPIVIRPGIYLEGTFGDDTLEGTPGQDTMLGRGGDDLILGREDNDQIYGGSGSDDLRGGYGLDQIFGGSGNDILSGAQDDDRLEGGDGRDTISGGAGVDTIAGGAGADNLNGGDGHDTISGEAGNDVLSGGAGDDTLRGDQGSDVLNGGDGDDDLFGGMDRDEIQGSNGRDTVSGGKGNDTLRGGNGRDSLDGGAGHDSLFGGTANDVLLGGAGNDQLDGGEGHDDLSGGAGDDVLEGYFGYDNLSGEEGNDLLRGGYDRDYLLGGGGNDILYGGEGNDGLGGGDGNDILYGGEGNDGLGGDDGRDTIYGGIGNDNVSGGNGHDTLYGGDGRDTISGGIGNDNVSGGNGQDTLAGNEGNDTLTGGLRSDTFIFASGADTVTDFDASDENERIDLSDVFSTYDDLVLGDHLRQEGRNAVIDTLDGDTMTLENVRLAELDPTDFIF